MEAKDKKYIEAVGRRKTSVARVRLFPGAKFSIKVNERPLEDYFPTKELQNVIHEVIKAAGIESKFAITVQIVGGGVHSQADAFRQGLARVLNKQDAELRPLLKKAGMLTRDARAKERRKFGLKKARKSPQWSKR
jgi:small subunit ribosomal protein S9